MEAKAMLTHLVPKLKMAIGAINPVTIPAEPQFAPSTKVVMDCPKKMNGSNMMMATAMVMVSEVIYIFTFCFDKVNRW